MRESYGFLRLASRLANPVDHPSQVRTQVLVLQTCVDLCRLESPFGLSFTLQETISVLTLIVKLTVFTSTFLPQVIKVTGNHFVVQNKLSARSTGALAENRDLITNLQQLSNNP